MTKPSLIIFDLDGVLIDTVELHFYGWQAVAKVLGVPFTREDNRMLKGVPRKQALTMLAGNRSLDKETEDYLLNLKAQIYRRHLKNKNDLKIQGVDSMLSELRDMNILLGLASASRHTGIILEKIGIGRMFDVISDGNFEGKPKPSPEQLQYINSRLNVSAENCLVIEDSIAGLEAARQCGMHCLAIGDSLRNNEITKNFLHTLAGVNAGEILEIFEQAVIQTSVKAG